MNVTGATRVAGVIGWPVAHSHSPRLQNYWLHQYGIDGVYVAFPVTPPDVERAIRSLPALGIRGVNVTVPHKETAFALMDECGEAANRMGAVNTIIVRDDGSLYGLNTDGFGFIENLRAEAAGWVANAGPAVVIGAGGAARGIVCALLDEGATEIRIANRTRARSEALADAFGRAVIPVNWDDRAAALEGAALLVNTTTLGMTGQPELDLPLDALPETAVVNDIVYAPLKTRLLTLAKSRGNRCVDGLGMLLHQGRPGFEAWFGRDPAVTIALRAHILGGAG